MVTWNSDQPNSYFYHPLAIGAPGAGYGFTLSFDWVLNDAVTNGAGMVSRCRLGSFISADAVSANFLRGTGYHTTEPR